MAERSCGWSTSEHAFPIRNGRRAASIEDVASGTDCASNSRTARREGCYCRHPGQVGSAEHSVQQTKTRTLRTHNRTLGPPHGMTSPAGRPVLEGEEAEYAAMIQQTDAERRERGCGFIEVAGIEARTRWEAERARHHPWGSRARPGLADGTQEALRSAQHQLLICLRHECRSLVHLQSARQQARAAGRDALAAGDGCASRLCTLGRSASRAPKRKPQSRL